MKNSESFPLQRSSFKSLFKEPPSSKNYRKSINLNVADLLNSDQQVPVQKSHQFQNKIQKSSKESGISPFEVAKNARTKSATSKFNFFKLISRQENY